ncbi:MAG: Stk1 family PASTA domain-containing Ser/Thr kinase [Acidimicrobiia bacterium]|nr:Stk1 family PASTA domain-containing Ser/Thr kinase [Acidimicrobiia bacterium]
MSEARILGDRYRLTGHIARGGMADVWEAEDLVLSRQVAVKILHDQFARDEAFVRRFQKEAKAAANLNHPNIVSIYDWSQEGDTYYMVMELITGRTLRDILRNEGALLPRRAAEIMAESAAALAVAHEQDVVHRDFKAANVMIAGDGTTKVADFGIYFAVDDSDELTKTGAVIGTATYFSPEQAQGLPVDARSDIYSMGVVLYEMLAGAPPFSADSAVAVAYQHVSEPPTPLRTVNPDIPSDLEAIVMTAMEKNPDDRYQTAGELRADLLRYLAGDPIAASSEAPTRMIRTPPATVPPDETARAVALAHEEPETPLWTYAATIGGLLVLLVAGIFILTRLLSGGGDEVAEITVPDVVGMDADSAFDAIQDADLRITRTIEPSETVPAGIVISTQPEAGVAVDARSIVRVVVSGGAEQFPVPTLIGLGRSDAEQLIADQGFVLGPISESFSDTIPEGSIIDQDPSPGTAAPPGTQVSIEVSTGPRVLTMPNVIGLAKESAERRLARDGFETIEIQEEYSEEFIGGFVIGSDPDPDDLVIRGDTVTLIVSKGPPPVAAPDLSGLTVAQAEAALEPFGLLLVVDATTEEVTLDSGLDGLIAFQEPPALTELERGSTITVRLGELREIAVPSVLGRSEEEARSFLEGLGLLMEVTGTVEDAANVGLVVSQDPTGGTLPEGSVVGVVLGVAPATTTTTSTTTTTTSTTTTTVP